VTNGMTINVAGVRARKRHMVEVKSVFI
jgi:hypothetical protein